MERKKYIALDELKTEKLAGIDGMRAEIVKECGELGLA